MSQKNTAIILAAGKGSRMHSEEPKQFLPVHGKPLLFYTLRAFEASPVIEDIVVVSGEEDIRRVYDDIIDKFNFQKVSKVVCGGEERYVSAYRGLLAAGKETAYAFIHDGARPCVSPECIRAAYELAKAYDAVIAAVPEQDTVRRVRGDKTKAGALLDRNEVWRVQTPQVFAYRLILQAYERFFAEGKRHVTDDAAVVEAMTEHPIMIAPGSYANIKVTTPEDLRMVGALLADKA